MTGTIVRSKIVATVGPACRDKLKELAEAGVDVFRLNTAHGNTEEHEETIARIRQVERQLARPLAVLVDLAGPKIRLGRLTRDPMPVEPGVRFRLLREGPARTPTDLTCSYSQLYRDLREGDVVLFADGTVRMRVTARHAEFVELVGESWGEIRSNQGINLPGVSLQLTTVTAADQEYARWAVRAGADFVSQSFVRSVDDVRQIREIVDEASRESGRNPEGFPAVVAKIEKREALRELEAIVQAAGAVMVARGDLGVEIDVAETPVVQKRILSVCRQRGRPAIVATQMLDSMQNSPRPTRAEATDVANAVLDGADACMLSGETAVGAYPVESVEVMNRILRHTECLLADGIRLARGVQSSSAVHRVTSAIIAGCGVVAEHAGASLIAVITRSGATALALSQQRLGIPVLGGSPHVETARKLCLCWGIDPQWITPDVAGGDAPELLLDRARERGLLSAGDRAVIVTGRGIAGRTHNEIAVYEETEG